MTGTGWLVTCIGCGDRWSADSSREATATGRRHGREHGFRFTRVFELPGNLPRTPSRPMIVKERV